MDDGNSCAQRVVRFLCYMEECVFGYIFKQETGKSYYVTRSCQVVCRPMQEEHRSVRQLRETFWPKKMKVHG